MGDLEPTHREPAREPLGPAHLRAADADRRRVTDELQRHYVAGRLSQDELDERVSRALAARTFGDLDAELHDLPRETGPRTPSEPRPAPDDDATGEAEAAGHDGSFRTHATSYLLVMALLVAIWLLTSPGGYFWPVWPMLGWGFGLAAHGLGRRGGIHGRRDIHGRRRRGGPERGSRRREPRHGRDSDDR